MNDINYSYKSGDFEVRYSTGKMAELVKWYDYNDNRYCYSIAYFVEGEDWDLKFVGSRPFDDFNKGIPQDIWIALKNLHDILVNINKNDN